MEKIQEKIVENSIETLNYAVITEKNISESCCPVCGGNLDKQGKCSTCYNCGYSLCGI
jgi:hypothetical protein